MNIKIVYSTLNQQNICVNQSGFYMFRVAKFFDFTNLTQYEKFSLFCRTDLHKNIMCFKELLPGVPCYLPPENIRPSTLLPKRLWHRCFSATFAKIFRAPFLQNTSRRLLLVFLYCQKSILCAETLPKTSFIFRQKWIYEQCNFFI